MTHALNLRIRNALETVAKKKTIVSYRMLAIEAEVPGPHVIHKLTHCLEDIFREDHLKGDMSLVPLAVSRGEPAVPRPGFYILLRELGLYDGADQGPEAIAEHQRLVEKIYETISGK